MVPVCPEGELREVQPQSRGISPPLCSRSISGGQKKGVGFEMCKPTAVPWVGCGELSTTKRAEAGPRV